MIRSAFVLIIAMTGLASCQEEVIMSTRWPMENNQWVNGDFKTTTIEATDTTTRYAMDLELSWDKTYDFENLYIRTKTKFPSGKEVVSVPSLEMAEKNGDWAGNCSGNTCTLSYPLQKVFTFPEIGTYTWSVEPFMRIDTVNGLKSLRVTCRKIKK